MGCFQPSKELTVKNDNSPNFMALYNLQLTAIISFNPPNNPMKWIFLLQMRKLKFSLDPKHPGICP